MSDPDGTLPPDAETRQRGPLKLPLHSGSALTRDLWLKLTAIGLAILLWFITTGKEPTARPVRVRLQLQLDSTLVLRGAPPEINAIVQGAPSELLKLGDRSATISRQINAQAPDTVVLDLTTREVELPQNVYATVTDVFPKRVALDFVPTLTRKVPVHSNIRVIGPASAGAPTIEVDPTRVEISGPRLAVIGVAFVRTDSTAIPISDSLPHQVAIDTAHLGVTVRPSQVRVRVIAPRPPAAPRPIRRP